MVAKDAETKIVAESDFTRVSAFCARPERWTAPDNQATECEVTDLVAAFVRAIQPDLVIETGSHRGFTSAAIAQAMCRNGHGRFVTLEANEALASEAERRIAETCNLPRDVSVEVVRASSLDYTPPGPIDFAWLDSGGGLVRYQEFIRFFRYFHERTIVGIHDTAPHQGDVPEIIDALTSSGRFRSITLPTPRGVTFGHPVQKRDG